ncbi:hypothetical protein PT286_04380 [Neisseriaceae bacterium ESL0693]|nr:hypothetical protein [Neisseriaceae bacterium ESL0693]
MITLNENTSDKIQTNDELIQRINYLEQKLNTTQNILKALLCMNLAGIDRILNDEEMAYLHEIIINNEDFFTHDDLLEIKKQIINKIYE